MTTTGSGNGRLASVLGGLDTKTVVLLALVMTSGGGWLTSALSVPRETLETLEQSTAQFERMVKHLETLQGRIITVQRQLDALEGQLAEVAADNEPKDEAAAQRARLLRQQRDVESALAALEQRVKENVAETGAAVRQFREGKL